MLFHSAHGIYIGQIWAKVLLVVDKDSKYVANCFPYVGKNELRSMDERVSDHVVIRLAEAYLKKGRNITTDNYFTSVKLANLLKSKNTIHDRNAEQKSKRSFL